MGLETYYLHKSKVTGIGEIFLLNEFEAIDSSGGGASLFGSTVDINKGSWGGAFHTDYPVPLNLYEPGCVLKELEKRKTQLEITGDVVLRKNIASGQRKLVLNKSFQVGISSFPAIPFGAKFQIDYSRVKTITINYGAGTYYEYILLGLAGRLYDNLKGKPTTDMGGDFLRRNGFISMIQVASNWSVDFESTVNFDANIEPRLDVFNADGEINGKVKFSKKSTRTIKAEVSGTDPYVVGLMSTNWEDLSRF